MTRAGNLFSGLPESLPGELFTQLVSRPNLRIERIVSRGQGSPPGFWYDQEWDEWVVLLAGSAQVLFEGENEARVMTRGDYVHIPAHRRHRVEWTNPAELTVWLAVHYR
jgi:cupin 2 domain-containing protein